MSEPARTLAQFDIAGRSGFVTGAASGIGLAYAEVLAEAGARVTLTDIDAEGVRRETERLLAAGHDVRCNVLDVTDRAACGAAVDAHAAAFGGLDICFANAGLGEGPGWVSPTGERVPDGQVDSYDDALWDRSIAINLTGSYNTMRHAARVMKAGGKGGSIIATASNAGMILEPIVPMPYHPAKAGVLHMVRALALELAAHRIRVNAIAPGPFVTNIGDGWAKKDPAVKAAFDKTIPLGSMAETYQMKPLALYLASDASSFMTGSTLLIDGGVALGAVQ
ncbi:SDR family NAD(P)-dependent oxidoreductase [Parerythrobacter aestuarii]|uniref:SDR family NAD(P)-dependent oxidoreductase n=1 Tax=Parerythrobacter aestuarii TaxID=3020909 RepID=UPI0024DEF5E1|nr:SDR family NAD(P)-dependent oxidoreductase [Parerythrobacter aestuarii]